MESGIQRVNAIIRDTGSNLSEVRLRTTSGTPSIKESDLMKPLKDSYTAIQKELKTLKKGLKENDKLTANSIISPLLTLKKKFAALVKFNKDFEKAIKEGNAQLARKAFEEKEEAERKAEKEAAAQAEKKKRQPKQGEFYKYISPPSEAEDPEQKEKIEDSFVENSIYKIATQPTISTSPTTRKFQINFESVKTPSQQLPTVKLKDSVFYKSFKKVKKPKEEEPFRYDDDPPPPQRMARQIKIGSDGTRTGQNVLVKQERLERKLEKLIEHYLKNGI